MPTPYYIVSAILFVIAAILHSRCRREFRRGHSLGYKHGYEAHRSLVEGLSPVPTTRSPVMRHVVTKRAEMVCAAR